jgi:site-specific DNA-methyltransferase (adenine-specific)
MWDKDVFWDKVLEGDCLDILPNLPEKCIDMILCDLPYGSSQNPWDKVIDLGRLWAEYKRIITDRGVIVLTGQGKFTAQLIVSNLPMFKYKLVWIKSKPTNFLNAQRQPLRRHEDICVFYNQQPVFHPQMFRSNGYDKGSNSNKMSGSYGKFMHRRKINYSGMRYPNDLLFFEDESPGDWIYMRCAETEGSMYHPCQKPVGLGRYLIRTIRTLQRPFWIMLVAVEVSSLLRHWKGDIL